MDKYLGSTDPCASAEEQDDNEWGRAAMTAVATFAIALATVLALYQAVDEAHPIRFEHTKFFEH